MAGPSGDADPEHAPPLGGGAAGQHVEGVGVGGEGPHGEAELAAAGQGTIDVHEHVAREVEGGLVDEAGQAGQGRWSGSHAEHLGGDGGSAEAIRGSRGGQHGSTGAAGEGGYAGMALEPTSNRSTKRAAVPQRRSVRMRASRASLAA